MGILYFLIHQAGILKILLCSKWLCTKEAVKDSPGVPSVKHGCHSTECQFLEKKEFLRRIIITSVQKIEKLMAKIYGILKWAFFIFLFIKRAY